MDLNIITGRWTRITYDMKCNEIIDGARLQQPTTASARMEYGEYGLL